MLIYFLKILKILFDMFWVIIFIKVIVFLFIIEILLFLKFWKWGF